MDLQKERYLWQLFHLEEDIKGRFETLDDLKEENVVIEKKESSMDLLLKSKKKEYASTSRNGKKLDKKLMTVVKSVDEVTVTEMRLIQERKLVLKKKKSSENKVTTIENQFKSQKETVTELEDELKVLADQASAIELRMVASSKESTLLKGEQLQEYHTIKEKAQVQTTKLRNEMAAVREQLL